MKKRPENNPNYSSERKRAEGEQPDPLTGLPGMLSFFILADERRKAIRERNGIPAFLFINFNGLKYYNRKYGFAEGDRLLKGFAELLTQCFEKENCCRYGQDHFGVLSEEEGLQERIEKLFESSKTLNDGNSIPIRIGIYLDRDEGVDINSICDRTKIAVDSIKGIYRSCFRYFDTALQDDEEKQQHIITNLDRAIEEGWIQAYVHPIIRAINGKVCNEEALARWIDPEYGFLSPADFIPILEKAGLIYKLDLCILDQILEKQRIQREAGWITVPASINLSRVDFDACDIVDEICRRVDASGSERKNITIEITESIIGSDFDFMKVQIERFRELGFPVWMDDFGSGYSSLDVLQSIRFDLIKFDMHFMRQLDKGESGKIILTELIKMANALGVDTICEGVETEFQCQFLQDIGCSKLQGFYYDKPIALSTLFERYKKGLIIGFENPEESEYFDAVGRVNLYDLTVVASNEEDAFQNIFNTLPMAILETKGGKIRLVRCNPSYREFLERAFGGQEVTDISEFTSTPYGIGDSFMETTKKCCETGNRIFFDDKVSDAFTVHSVIKKIAENPVNGIFAVALVILYVSDDSQETTYANIARALAVDYFNIFYVDLDTENFIEYTSTAGAEKLTMERHGEDFFAASRRDSLKILYEEDRNMFVQNFTKENVVKALDEQGTFTLSYRLADENEPVYVLMKANRMQGKGNKIIIGVTSVDVQMKQKADIDRIRQEQIFFSRIKQLSVDYIALYTVDLPSGHYTEYNALHNYQELGLEREGEDFFRQSEIEGRRVICPEDLERYLTCFTKENILRTIEESGIFVLKYRLMINGEPKPVSCRIARTVEADGEKLIVGVTLLEDPETESE